MRRTPGTTHTAALLCSLTAACTAPPPPPPDPASHAADVEAWSQSRIASLLAPVAWLSLAGLYWLEPGSSTFGADTTNRLVYAPPGRALPARVGTFSLGPEGIHFDADPDVTVTSKHGTITSVDMAFDGDEPTVLRTGALEWRIIRRADQLAVRLWDTLSEIRMGFAGIERFPVSLDWRFAARFIPSDPPDTIEVPNILGSINRTPAPGVVEFRHDGRKYRLAMWKDSDDPANYFTAFADRTNGGASYGGGRFLWVDAPDADGWTVVDFNRAYNPPCVFTEFATCPLAPRQNRLPFAVEAGEKMYSGGH